MAARMLIVVVFSSVVAAGVVANRAPVEQSHTSDLARLVRLAAE